MHTKSYAVIEKVQKPMAAPQLGVLYKIESVELALKLLDGYDLRGHKVSVERAKFQMKGDYNPNLKPKKRKKKDKEKIKKMQEKLFDWRPDKLRGERSKHERVVIIKNLFDPKIFDNDVGLILEYQQDLREECSKCGDVRKVVIYDRHQEGVAQVTFREAEEADTCIKLLNGRWFCQRKITAETWDGKTKYKVIETEEEAQLRLKKWSAYLEAEELKKGKKVGTPSGELELTTASNTVDSDKKESETRTEEISNSIKGGNSEAPLAADINKSLDNVPEGVDNSTISEVKVDRNIEETKGIVDEDKHE